MKAIRGILLRQWGGLLLYLLGLLSSSGHGWLHVLQIPGHGHCHHAASAEKDAVPADGVGWEAADCEACAVDGWMTSEAVVVAQFVRSAPAEGIKWVVGDEQGRGGLLGWWDRDRGPPWA
jgi:hypothetical protein